MEEQLKDILVRGTAWDGKIRVFAVRTTNIVEELRRRHDSFPTATAALGRTLSVGAMMGAMLKGKERLTIQVKGDGPIGQVVVDANANGEIRGYVDHPQAHHASNDKGKLDVAGAVGTSGYIHVTKDLGLKEPYRGSVPLISGELAEDFTYYFAVSEQTPSAVGVGVLVENDNSVLHAGGYIVQLMPGLADAEITRLEQAVAKMPPVTTLLAQGQTPEDLLRWLVGEDLVIHDTMPLVFKCQCSEERVEQTLISLGESELRMIIEDDARAEVVCHFCNEKYSFGKDRLEQLLVQAKPKPVQ
ncbi:Hsp33 family molecular chaperone HslO [Paenibacillus sp. 1011MAR3C5]|uniref:Hsp33 family molecular chaperone HslO n=1 Tax=Paenibacillus sp. 1011MAR3C5 TaxID=1675787 RepID=UPI000E6CD27C|nr:Hsp33 family molecular chaperone HslO [Paenibacillus sp. 1011MAR3C5]RJE83598.1 Hsp33 family molecular chaperone HslO [Paenibacillus sp. 1011MAR3C5]